MARARKPPAGQRASSQAGRAAASALHGQPPHSLNAEVSVLGSMILNNEAIDVVVPLIGSASFFSTGHQKIFAAIVSLHSQQEGNGVDFVTLGEELARRGELDSVGGEEYIQTLTDGVPAASNVEYYAEIVREKAVTRELLGAAREIFDAAAQDNVHSRELLDEAEARIFRIAEQGVKTEVAPIQEVLKATFERIDQARGGEGMLTGVATGFPDLDDLTSGLQAGEFLILAARPSMGKTTLALNILAHVGMKLREPAVIFSLEMSREQLARNMLCAHARMDSHRLRRGRLNQNELAALPMHVGALSEAPIFIDDTPGLHTYELRSKVRRLKASKGCRLVIVDYLQLMQGPTAENRQVEISNISRSLKGLAREMRIPILAVAQLNRQAELRPGDKRPRMADLRESGSLEQDADVVMLLHRQSYYTGEEDDMSAELIIAKQRNGPTGRVDLTFLRRHMRFESGSAEGQTDYS